MIFAVVVSLGALGIFKYADFAIENINAIFKTDIALLKIGLPIGISFYTFQALSYTIDVHRNKIEATNDPIAFFAFVSFFPQLVAGPIERATNLLPQFMRKRTFDYDMAADGCRQMLWGFCKKILITFYQSVIIEMILWQENKDLGGFYAR